MRKFFNVLSSHKLLSALLLIIFGIIVFSIIFYSSRSYYRYLKGKSVEFNDHYISTIRFGGIKKSTLDFNSTIDLIDKNNVTMIYERILP